jgi:O-antigen/teichoic acid export membrane protein
MNQGIEKGILVLTIAQCVMVLSGYILHAGLGRLWGPEKYGSFVLVMSILVWIELSNTSGIPTAVTKFISEKENGIKGLLSQGMKLQLILSIGIVAITFFTAPLIASLLGDENLSFYLRLASIDVPFMGFLVLHLGALAGLRAFTREALTIVFYWLFKILVIFTLVLSALSLKGAFIGNTLASIAAFLVVLKFLPPLREVPKLKSENQKIIRFAIPLTLYQLSYNILIILDLLLVKSLISAADQTGYYASAHAIAKTPYFIFYAITLALLPLLSNAIAKGDNDLTVVYIKKSLRYLLMLLVPLILLITKTSEDLISFVYSSAYLPAAPALSILIFGFAFLSLFLISNAILIANNESKEVLAITVILLPVSCFLNFQLIPVYGIQGAAIATTTTLAMGSIITSTLVYKRFRTLVDIRSCLKIFTSAISVFFISKAIPLSGIFIVPKYLILFILYFFLLYIMKEIKKNEVENIRLYFKRFRITTI